MARTVALLALTLLAACASGNYRTSQNLFQQGRNEEGLLVLKKVVDTEPENVEAATQYFSRLGNYSKGLLMQARDLQQQGRFDDARKVYENILRVDTANTVAQDALVQLPKEIRQSKLIAESQTFLRAGDVNMAAALTKQVLAENPGHYAANLLQQDIDEAVSNATGRRLMGEMNLKLPKGDPISLDFRDAAFKMVMDVLGRSNGVNFLMDKDVRPDLRVTVSVRNASLEEAVKMILHANQLEFKVLNANSVLIYPSLPEKLKVYQDLMVKGFYLQNSDVKQVQANLKTILKTKDTVIDEKLNLLIMRDTPDVIAAAEKIISMQDIQEPEVMLEVEVLEVDRANATKLGIQWPASVALTPLSSNSGNGLTVSDLRQINSSTVGVSSLSATLNLNKTITDSNILANPRIRVKNRETAKIMIGDKLPVITNSITSTGVISPSVNYLDVGLKLEVQPDIRLKSDIGIKVDLEVSSVTSTITMANGTQTYQIGTRNASTRLRLRDGETQILGGLINDQESNSSNRIPGIGDMPVLDRVFGSKSDSKNRTELVLAITPHLVHNLVLPGAGLTQFWSGTEAALRMPDIDGGASAGGAGNKSTSNGADAAPGRAAKPTALPLEPAKNVELSWKASAADKAGVFSVSLVAKADGTMRSLPAQISFDPAAYQILAVEEGGYFKRDGANTTFSNSVDPVKGRIFVTAIRNDAIGAGAGEFSVFNIKLRPTGSMPSELKVLMAEPVVGGTAPPTVSMPAPFTGLAVSAQP